MWGVIIITGVAVGYILSIPMNSFSNKRSGSTKSNQLLISRLELGIATGLIFLISYLTFGFTQFLFQALILNCLLITVTVIDIRHRIIPNYLVFIIFIFGSIFLSLGRITITDAFMGMIAGGGLLYFLALIPKAMGGGDIKFMFSMGVFLGLKGTLWALMLGFIAASLVSLFLLTFKRIGRKDHIPFGPFLALGSYIVFHFIL